MVPTNHISVLIADGRRAKEWELGLRKQGLAGQRIETSGSDAAKGDYWLVVPDSERLAAQRFVSDVLSGKQNLPASAPVGGPLLWGAGVIVFAVLALLVASLLS